LRVLVVKVESLSVASHFLEALFVNCVATDRYIMQLLGLSRAFPVYKNLVIMVKDQCRSALFTHTFETQRYHFVDQVTSSSNFGSEEDGKTNESILGGLDNASEDPDTREMSEDDFTTTVERLTCKAHKKPPTLPPTN
jgi:hypothetical protein